MHAKLEGTRMWKSIKRFWAYLGAMLGQKVEEKADPKIQLEQAIEEAKQRHKGLSEQAAAVLGNQRQLELKLNRSLEDVEKLQGSARQALLKADAGEGRRRSSPGRDVRGRGAGVRDEARGRGGHRQGTEGAARTGAGRLRGGAEGRRDERD